MSGRYTRRIPATAVLVIAVTLLPSPALGQSRATALALSSGEAAVTGQHPLGVVGFLQSPAGLWIGIAAAFIAVLALLWVLLVSSQRTAGSRTLERGLRAFGRGDRHPSREEIVLPTSRFTERAIDLVGRVPKPKGFDQRLQLQLDRAAWPIRSNEFLVLSVASGILGAMLLGSLARSTAVGVVGLILVSAVPVVIMRVRIERRRRRFVDQLPQTLQLLAGSLRAGYGLLQAIDTVVQESGEPTSSELSRVLTEARLGMPLDQALEGMAQRLDSEDFHWVVLAIGIQREVGGNLAELLTTVAETMRNRAALRRQVRVLSAEGRMSAWVVGLMPFFVAFALQVVNPGYVGELFEQFAGIVMFIMGVVLLLLGAFWLSRIIKIEV